jgi:K+-sensing histidine kinase KdpD
MPRTTRTILLHYGGAVFFTALAVLLRRLLRPWLGSSPSFPILYGAVALSVWFGSYRPALLAAVLGFLAGDWLLVGPRGTTLRNAPKLTGLILYLLCCAIGVGLGETMHTGRRPSLGRRRRLEQEAEGRGRAARTSTGNTLPGLARA